MTDSKLKSNIFIVTISMARPSLDNLHTDNTDNRAHYKLLFVLDNYRAHLTFNDRNLRDSVSCYLLLQT